MAPAEGCRCGRHGTGATDCGGPPEPGSATGPAAMAGSPVPLSVMRSWPERIATEMKRRRLRRPRPTGAAALRAERKSAAAPSQRREAVAIVLAIRGRRARASSRTSVVRRTATATATAAAGIGTSRPLRFASPSTRPAARWRRMRDKAAGSVSMRRCLCLCLCDCYRRRSCGRPRPQRIGGWRLQTEERACCRRCHCCSVVTARVFVYRCMRQCGASLVRCVATLLLLSEPRGRVSVADERPDRIG